MQTRIQTHVLQRKIGRRPGTEHEQKFERHHRSVHYETHQKYANWMAESLCLLLRRVCERQEPYMHFPVAEQILEKANSLTLALHNALESSDKDSASPDI